MIQNSAVFLDKVPGSIPFAAYRNKQLVSNMLMYDSSFNLKNVSQVGYVFTVEGNDKASDVRGKLNNYGLPTSKFMTMNRMSRGVQALITDNQ